MKETSKNENLVSAYHVPSSPKELYLGASAEQRMAFRDAYLEYTGMPYTTFYYKVREDRFRPLELKAFNKILEKYPLSIES